MRKPGPTVRRPGVFLCNNVRHAKAAARRPRPTRNRGRTSLRDQKQSADGTEATTPTQPADVARQHAVTRSDLQADERRS